MNSIAHNIDTQKHRSFGTFIGSECRFGHTLRYSSNGACVDCNRKASRLDAELGKQSMRRFRAQSEHRNESRAKRGLPAPTRHEPLRCECCNKRRMEGLQLDHDHKTGEFRGWLCGECNRAIGLLGDTEKTVLNAFMYLCLTRKGKKRFTKPV